jgi:hypothetical protein
VKLLSQQGTDGLNPLPKLCHGVIPTIEILHVSGFWSEERHPGKKELLAPPFIQETLITN